MNSRPQTAHLVYGPTAAGNSTYARALAAETHGVRFAIDEWMHALHSAEMPARLEMDRAMKRVAGCEAQVGSVAQQILAAGTDVVLELGLLRQQDREAVNVNVEDAGYAASFHFIDADPAVRWQRVLRRNAEKGETHTFDVTPKMFEAMEARSQRPSEGELARSNIARGSR